MRGWWLLLGAFCLVPFPGWAAESLTLGGGVEYFRWREFAPLTGQELLEESGARYFVNLDASRPIGQGDWVYGFHGRVYSGSPHYDGQYQDGTPAESTTDYSGASAELDFSWHLASRSSADPRRFWSVRYALGVDVWRRNILGPGGYLERYSLIYGRIGFAFEPQQRWGGYFGVKLPLTVDEKVDFSSFGLDDPRLHPQGDFSLFAQIHRRVGRYWQVNLYYDSYRFKRSGDVLLTQGGVPVVDINNEYVPVFQPESHQDSYGIGLAYVF